MIEVRTLLHKARLISLVLMLATWMLTRSPLRSTRPPISAISSSMWRASMMSGTFSSTTSWSVRMQAAIIGRIAFLFPEARTVPRSGMPPSISNVDMFLFS